MPNPKTDGFVNLPSFYDANAESRINFREDGTHDVIWKNKHSGLEFNIPWEYFDVLKKMMSAANKLNIRAWESQESAKPEAETTEPETTEPETTAEPTESKKAKAKTKPETEIPGLD